ncbi:hypothetical protein [Kitasatospora sp. NPDC047058]|uniref:hypothetical protein n=1 Tax=Kitasatospora sp. NPDC047058 TaxID=3155620 RepID=UPI0033CC6904
MSLMLERGTLPGTAGPRRSTTPHGTDALHGTTIPHGASAPHGSTTPHGTDELRELRRFAFEQGAGKAFVAPGPQIDPSIGTTSGQLPAGVRPDAGRPLALGTSRLLRRTPFPAALRPEDGPAAGEETLDHLLVTAFGLQRREPSNSFNDHRVVPSVRSKFPVRPYLLQDGATRYLDVQRHALLDVEGTPAAAGEQGTTVVLAGRHTDLPPQYALLRGPLVDLEIGHNLRSLYLAAQLFGVRAELELPTPDPEGLAERIGVRPAEGWAYPVAVRLDGATPRWRPGTDRPAPTGDPALDRVLRIDRLTRPSGAPAPAAGTTGTGPYPVEGNGLTWAEVLWNRTAGRTPEGVGGFSGVRAPQPYAAVADSLALACAPPPSPLLAAVARHVRLTLCAQDVEGLPDGIHRVEDDRLTGHLARPGVHAALDAQFGYPLSGGNDCSVRHATFVWTFTADLRALFAEFGPSAWKLLQYACGWSAHGLVLGAAAYGMYARPARAFDEVRIARTLELDRDQTAVFQVVCGTGRFREPMLDLRS